MCITLTVCLLFNWPVYQTIVCIADISIIMPFVVQLKYSGEADYAQVCSLNLRASHLQSVQHLDKVSHDKN